MRHCFLPPDIGDRIPGHPTQQEMDLRARRQSVTGARVAPGVYTAANRQVQPGNPMTMPYGDPRAIEAEKGLAATREMLSTIGNSFGADGLAATVHYGLNYDNAFWDGAQMVFGDGDGQYFAPFTGPIDVCAHEIGHGVTGDQLDYQGQAGALNESMSDCIGAVVRQRVLGLKIDNLDGWLIGAGLFLPQVKARGLRDMLNPGTAYNDPKFGRDTQPAHMKNFYKTSSDNGGVHTNSGIPNRAFALASVAVADPLLVLRIWQSALNGLNDPAATFAKFATETVHAATGPAAARAINTAWAEVGVLDPVTSDPPAPGSQGDGCLPFLNLTEAQQGTIRRRASKTKQSVDQWVATRIRAALR